jgi:hypothetical protein
MPANAGEQLKECVDSLYRTESGRILATLIRLLGDFDLAEDALQEAFVAALKRWPQDGVPANPRAWLVSTGRFKAIDALRRRARFDASQAKIAEQFEAGVGQAAVEADESVADDRLPPCAFGSGGFVSPAGPESRGPVRLRTRPGAHAAGTGTAVPRKTAAGIGWGTNVKAVVEFRKSQSTSFCNGPVEDRRNQQQDEQYEIHLPGIH